MADPVYTFSVELATGSFTDLTTRIERASWGQAIVDMFHPPVVGNGLFELANDDGLMGPRVNSSFQPGHNVKLTVTCSSVLHPLFYGRIIDISLQSALGQRTTIIEAVDDWDRLQEVKWSTRLFSGTNVKSMFTELMSISAVRSFQVDATGITSAANLGYAWYNDAPAVESLHELVSTGDYQLLVDGNGTYQLRGPNWSLFDASSTQHFNTSSWAETFRSEKSRETVINRVRISGKQLEAATDLRTLAYMPPAVAGVAGSALTIAASGGTFGHWFNFNDPDNATVEDVPVYSLAAMVQSTDWYVSANNDGSGADMSSGVTLSQSYYGGNGAVLYTNNNPVDVYLARSQIKGYPLEPVGDLIRQVDVASSQAVYGIRAFTMENRVLQWFSNDYIGTLATHIASNRKDGMNESQLTLVNKFPTQYESNLLGNVLWVTDPFSGPETTWRVRGTQHNLEFNQGLRHSTIYDMDTPEGPWGWGIPSETLNTESYYSSSSPTITNGGSGYVVGEVVTLSGVSAGGVLATDGASDTEGVETTYVVATVDGSGAILTVTLGNPGSYTTVPTSPVATTASASGTGATFTPSWTLGSVWATWDPSERDVDMVLSGGNLIATSANQVPSGGAVYSTVYKSGGKHYCELVMTTAEIYVSRFGVGNSTDSPTNLALGTTANSWAYIEVFAQKRHSDVGVSYGVEPPADSGEGQEQSGDVISVLLDLDAGELSFWVNGVDQGVAYTGLSGNLCPQVSTGGKNVTITANFGASAWTYTPPAGYTGWYTGSEAPS